MAKTVFVPETIVPSAFLNAINNPVFDDQDLDGHFGYITNDRLDPTPGSLLPEWIGFRDQFRAVGSGGLNITVSAGIVELTTGLFSVSQTTVSAPDNTTSIVYVNSSGVIEVSPLPPLRNLPIARVVTTGGAISSITDLRPRYRIFPKLSAIRAFGGSGDEGDFTATEGQILDQGKYFFRNFTVPLGVTITVSKGAVIRCSGNCAIDGTINVTHATNGSFGYAATLINGTTAGGGTGNGLGGGSGTGRGASYNYALAAYGSGGGSGFCVAVGGNADITVSNGGPGGGGISFEVAGTLTVTGSIVASGGAGGQGTLRGGTGVLSGGGGGSGGLIELTSSTSIVVTATATLDVRGGNGGNGIGDARGGGAGGGGIVALICPSINTTGANILIAAGTDGADGTGISVGGGTGGGFGGRGGVRSTSVVSAEAGRLILRNFNPVA